MLVTIDPNRAEPLFAQVAASLRREILAGRVNAGDRLPTARDLAGALNVNLHTVLRAYQQLRDEGIVDMRRGRGATVGAGAGVLREIAEEIEALVAKSREAGVDPGTLTSLVQEAARA